MDAAEAAAFLREKGVQPGVVLLDPPRKGCDPALIGTVAKEIVPERIVYISCEPSTLARDLNLFAEFGYETMQAAPFDLFPRTGHVETVCLLHKRQDP
jgi:23S rRNA (uracil1939-C5)-methyltransferase